MRRVLPADWTLPALEPHTEAFFTSGRMLIQRCADCQSVQHPPEVICHKCLGSQFDEREVRGEGTVHSFIIVHHPAHPSLADSVPYAVVLVSLDELPEVRITGNLLDTPLDQIRIGMQLRATWNEFEGSDGTTYRLPQWEVA
jgi:uncharacterized OB-fold protein